MQRIGVLGGISPQATMDFAPSACLDSAARPRCTWTHWRPAARAARPSTTGLQRRLDGAIRAVMEGRDGRSCSATRARAAT